MKDNQNLMIEFVKIVRRYPEIYDQTLDTYRTRFSEIAWAKVACHVRNELNEECTIEELKVKWKGIRSSFSRYRAKLNPQNSENNTVFKKYYLNDHLKFLEPFLKPRGSPAQQENDKSETTHTEPCNYVNVDVLEESDDYSVEEWNQIDIKPDITNRLDKQLEPEALQASKSTISDLPYCDNNKKRKFSFEGLPNTDDDEDLTFFKSILPDIRNFTIKEKRKLKVRILKLIDEIEKERES